MDGGTIIAETAQSTGSRLRKAWEVTTEGYDGKENVFAPTRSVARANIWSRLDDVWNLRDRRDRGFGLINVRRAAWADVRLPDEHPVVTDLSHQERRALLHAYGGTGLKAGYRDHYCTAEGDPPLVRLVMRGLMTGPVCPAAGYGGLCFFYLNWMGRQVALSMQPTYPTGY